ncbi:fas-associated death domain protein [Xylocopa sonorina]|uniref:fas-associated death domain protein n=1 Tax=Xylocopa sonorina TaxID=1818115 RepID=UPI00403B1EB6
MVAVDKTIFIRRTVQNSFILCLHWYSELELKGKPLANIMKTDNEYLSLCEEFLFVVQHHLDQSTLNSLKEYYAPCINSNRKLSQIKDIRALLKVLEKRDALSYDNIEPLLYISNNFLNHCEIQSKLNDYLNYLKNIQYPTSYNMYRERNTNKHKKSKTLNITESTTQTNKCNDEHETALQQMLLSCISERIGRAWRDTVRYLDVPEYQIDAIQIKYPLDLKEQSYEALKLFMYQYSNVDWKIKLIHALEKARRRDLKELVERLILESNK